MFNISLKHRIKTFIFILIFFIGIFGVSAHISASPNIPAANESAASFLNIPNALFAANSATTTSTDLSQGGSGLSISQKNVKISSSISQKSFGDTLLSMVNYFIGFLGFLATLAFVYAGVLWVLSGGTEELITKARKIMIYAGLGIVVVILSYSAVSFIASSGGDSTSSSSGGGVTGAACTLDSDCGSGSFCVSGKCSTTGTSTSSSSSGGADQQNAVKGGASQTAFAGNVTKIDKLNSDLDTKLDLTGLSDATKTQVKTAVVGSGTMDEKISNLNDLIKNSSLSTSEQDIIKNFIYGLTNLKLLQEELKDLYKNMPQTKETLDYYKDTSDALDDLMKDPTDKVKSSRFITKYKKLNEAITKFPTVKAAITAYPGSGNVPFTVQFDGLGSTDPSGGTISKYSWTYIDANGSEVSLGSQAVIIYEFKMVNTYAVRLRVSTSSVDKDGYKTAADGISIVYIKASPPTSKVDFRINGATVNDTYNVTLKDAKAGISFDPSPTTAALGRTITKYDWYYGDTQSETRLVPTTVVHTYTKAGEYYVKLSVTDNVNVTDKKIVKLSVKSLAADIQVTPSSGNVSTSFKFAADKSRSDDGVIKDYDWKITDSTGSTVTTSTSSSFSYSFTSPGDYKITLLVTDITGQVDKAVGTVKVTSRDPVANFSFSTPKQNYPDTIEFNAVDSYDPDQGDKLTYSWDFDGNGSFDVVDSASSKVTYAYKQTGDYKAKLQVKDSSGLLNQIQKKVTIKSVLSGDIVANEVAVRVGKSVSFGAKSANAVTYLWEFGDSNKTSTDKTTVSYTYNKTGQYTLKLHFFDKNNESNYDTKQILVGPGDDPIAMISYLVEGSEAKKVTDLCGKGKDGAVVYRSDKISFSAANSINTDGTSKLLSYDWKFPDGTKSSSKDTSFKFSDLSRKNECFSVSLTVTDQLTGKSSAKDEVYIQVINSLPSITDFTITPPDKTKTPVTPAKVQLQIINAKDADGTIKKYKWWYYLDGYAGNQMGTHTTTTGTTDITITSYGSSDLTNRYYFVAEVMDSDNGTYSSADRFGSVSYLDIKNGPNLSPVADFSVDKTTISAGDSISFVSSAYDPQGETLAKSDYSWDFDGDGEFDDITSGSQVSRQFNTPGEYKPRLKVSHRGLSSSVTKKVYVETSESLPQAAFTYKVNGNAVEFDASTTRYDPTLKDTTLRFEWDFDSATDADGNGTKDDDAQAKTIKTTYTYSAKSVYKVKLTVKDSLGQSGIVARTIDLNMTDDERKKQGYSSLRVSSSKNSMTTIDFDIIPATLKKGESADISVRVLNADGSVYSGKVYFSVLEGSGSFTPNPVVASGSKASSIFKSSDTGTIKIRVKAADTVYGDIYEDAVIIVK